MAGVVFLSCNESPGQYVYVISIQNEEINNELVKRWLDNSTDGQTVGMGTQR
jgi:hypothetical protein